MKKLTALLLALVMVFALVSCGNSNASAGSAQDPAASSAPASSENAREDVDEPAGSGAAPAELRVGTGNVLGTFLPWSENETCHWGCFLVYDYLFYWDENGDVYSDILDDWHY